MIHAAIATVSAAGRLATEGFRAKAHKQQPDGRQETQHCPGITTGRADDALGTGGLPDASREGRGTAAALTTSPAVVPSLRRRNALDETLSRSSDEDSSCCKREGKCTIHCKLSIRQARSPHRMKALHVSMLAMLSSTSR